MNRKKGIRCGQCGKRLKKGGDNYRLDCTVATDFDGYINVSADQDNMQKLMGEIKDSGLTERELQEQVYFNLKQKLCLDCRNKVVKFLKRLN